MKIHKEGHSILIGLFIVLLIMDVALYIFTPGNVLVHAISIISSIGFYLLILQFFRDPKRITPLNERHIIAPADGKVVVIEEVEEKEYFKDKRLQVSIFMSPFNVHCNRNPVTGILKYFKYHQGKYLVAFHPKSSELNERTTLVYETTNGQEVLIRQIAGALAKRIRWYIKEKDEVKQGDQFGFIKFGSRIDLFLPLDAKVNVHLGQKTKGGITNVADFSD